MGTSIPAWILSISIAVIAFIYLVVFLATRNKP